jgi:hypothetical protein
MSKPIIRIYQGDGEFIDREMTNDEFKQYQKDQESATANEAAEQAKAEAKAQAKAAAEGKLAALGLTTDDLRALGL